MAAPAAGFQEPDMLRLNSGLAVQSSATCRRNRRSFDSDDRRWFRKGEGMRYDTQIHQMQIRMPSFKIFRARLGVGRVT
jgi:hypothetical protein